MKYNAGFTLMELMTTIAIVAILSSIAVPNMIAWRNNMQFNSAARMVKSAIEGTRMDAIRSNMPARVNFIEGGQTFSTQKWNPTTNMFAAAQIHQLPPGVVLTNSSFIGDQLQFTSRGMPNEACLPVIVAEDPVLRLENNGSHLCQRILISRIGSSRIAACP